jgi:hypothetical protein
MRANAMLTAPGLYSRIAPSLAGLIVLAVFAGLWFGGALPTYNQLLFAWGIYPFRFPFLDIDGSLAAWDCSRAGVDVILGDPCDVLGRQYSYSPFWMTIDWIPLGRADRVWVGLALNVAFLASFTALPRPLSGHELALRFAAMLSTMVVFAVERANPDIIIFIMTVLMLHLLQKSRGFRTLGYAIAFLAGMIKYYPFVLLALTFRERIRIFVLLVIVIFFGFSLFFYLYYTQVMLGLPYIPQGEAFVDMLGAKNLPLGIFTVLQKHEVPRTGTIAIVITAMIAFLTAIVWAMIKLWRNSDILGALHRMDAPRRLPLLAGALLLAGCFVAGQSVGYRGVFLLMLIPGLTALGRDEAAGTAGRIARLAVMGVPPLMWAEAIRGWVHFATTREFPPDAFATLWTPALPVDFLVWSMREFAWWLLIAFLTTLLLGFLADRARSVIDQLRLLLKINPARPAIPPPRVPTA